MDNAYMSRNEVWIYSFGLKSLTNRLPQGFPVTKTVLGRPILRTNTGKNMAGGGIAGAIVALKNNRAMLRKRKLKEKADVYGQGGETKLNLKESTEQDMKRIREKIKHDKRQERKLWAISIGLAAFLLYSIFWWLFQ